MLDQAVSHTSGWRLSAFEREIRSAHLSFSPHQHRDIFYLNYPGFERASTNMPVDDNAPTPSPSMPMTDGVQPDTAGDSPASSTGAQSNARIKHVPIARHKTGYERPERARTSHACEPCRERKTKCDGERPACRRCLHTGTNCHYGYGKGWKKRK